MTYTVQQGEELTDVILNTTGTLDNWIDFLDLNNFSDWNPTLLVGQVIQIPSDAVIQPNLLQILQIYPACNNSMAADLQLQISTLLAIFTANIVFRADNNINARADSTILTADENI